MKTFRLILIFSLQAWAGDIFPQLNIIGTFQETNDSVSGKIFKVDTGGFNYKEIFQFPRTTDGVGGPHQVLVEQNSKLYGVANGSVSSTRLPVIFEYDLTSGNYRTLYKFSGTLATCTPLGLASLGTNKLIGMTQTGGINNKGFIYSLDIATQTLTKLYDFNGTTGGSPKFWMVNTSGTTYYGTAQEGANNCGVIFKFDASTNVYTKLFDFTQATDGKDPGMLTYDAANNLFYSTCKNGGANNNGTLFNYNPATLAYTKMLDFNVGTCPTSTATTYGGYPGPHVALAYNKLWLQTTSLNPSCFPTIPQSGYALTYKLSTNSFEYAKSLFFYYALWAAPTPYSSYDRTNIIPLSDTTFLTNQPLPGNSTAPQSEAGRIINVNFKSSAAVITEMLANYNITVPVSNMMQASNGKYYGIGMENAGDNLLFPTGGQGGLYEFDNSTKKMRNVKLFHEFYYGADPCRVSLMDNCDMIGYTEAGNEISGEGTIYKYNLSTGVPTKLLALRDSLGRMFFGSFNYTDYSSPILVGNKYYGIIGLRDYFLNPNYGYPTYKTNSIIYSLDKTTNVYTVLYDFSKTPPGFDGVAQLTPLSSTKLLGLAAKGGANNYGCIFEFDLLTNTPTIRCSFTSTIAANPQNPLFLASNGKYYFTSQFGGSAGAGSFCEYDPLTFTVVKKFDFSTTIGSQPKSGIVERAGKLYTTAWYNAAVYYGSLIEYDMSSGMATKLFDFGVLTAEGRPFGNLLYDGLNSLYFACTLGGSFGRGGLVKYNIVTGVPTILYDFYTNQITSGDIALSNCSIIATDIKEKSAFVNDVLIYPNPANSVLYVRSANSAGHNANIKISDVLGKTVLQHHATNTDETFLNISDLNPGIYFISILSEGNRFVQKFVKE